MLLIILALSYNGPAMSEAFGNTSLSIPRLGLSFYDLDALPHKKPWGLDYQWTVGTAFTQALNYRWWWVLETSFGFGKLSVQNRPYLSSFAGGAGLRFNIFEDDFRPHVGFMVHYLQFLGDGAKAMPLNLGWPIFVGLKPYMGLEWLFYSEMALLIDCGYGLYVNINEPFRRVLHTSLSFALYF
jgi:hypothetical protein